MRTIADIARGRVPRVPEYVRSMGERVAQTRAPASSAIRICEIHECCAQREIAQCPCEAMAAPFLRLFRSRECMSHDRLLAGHLSDADATHAFRATRITAQCVGLPARFRLAVDTVRFSKQHTGTPRRAVNGTRNGGIHCHRFDSRRVLQISNGGALDRTRAQSLPPNASPCDGTVLCGGVATADF